MQQTFKILGLWPQIAAIKTLDGPRDEKNPVFNMSSYKFEESRDYNKTQQIK